jgi:glutathione synthase/RimK-type ligase-like ATP-grasp enzyme
VNVTVGVMGRQTDPHAAAVAHLAQSKGATVKVIDTTQPTFAAWRWQDGTLVDDHGDAVHVDSVYVRSVAVPIPTHSTPEVDGRVLADWLSSAERRRRMLLHARAVHAGLEIMGALVVNSVDATWMHRSKPAADLRLRAAGIQTPRSLVTDDPASVRAFVETVGEAIRKPVAGGGVCVAVDPNNLSDAALANLAAAPALFQERVRGDDLRIYVMAGEVIAAAHIKTTNVDYRGHEDDVVGITADPAVEALSLKVADTLGMVFTGIDIKRSDDGELTVLDANPSPMFLGIERRTGQRITDHLAAQLVSRNG